MTDTSNLRNLPLWLQAAVLLGVPSVIALFLVYMIATVIAGRITNIERTQTTQSENVKNINEDIDRIERLVRNMCMVTAKNSDERILCGAP